MSGRTFLKVIGLVLLVPSVVIGVLPLIFANTSIGDVWDDQVISFFGHNILTITHTVTGNAHANVTPYVWVVAALGEIILLGIHVLKPIRKSRYQVGLSA